MRISTVSLAAALCVFSVLLGVTRRLQAAEPASPDAQRLEAELQSNVAGPGRRIPEATRHVRDLTPAQVQARAAEARNQGLLLKEKVEGQWLAALVTVDGPSPMSIVTRFPNWSELASFVRTNQALTEVWADGGAGQRNGARRLSAIELAALQNGDPSQPTIVTVTGKDPVTGQSRRYRLEFGFDAAARAAAELGKGDGGAESEAGLQPILGALRLQGAGAPTEPSLAEGGVIEQVQGEAGPVQRPGTKAVEEHHTQVLSDLLEWRRHLQKKSLGLTQDTNELLQAASALEDLAAKGIWIDDADALLTVDAFKNRFVYRRYVQGRPQTVTVTAIPSRAERVDEVTKAEAARRLEIRERAALAAGGKGIALVHRVHDVNGQPEVGPLVFSDDSVEGITSLLALLDRLPVTERARLRFDGVSRTIVDADFDGQGKNDRFFLTIQYPPGKVIHRERINPLTGEHEVWHERDGVLLRLVTDARITDYEYNTDREETATRTYTNTGSRNGPIKGPLLEETRTVESWQRDLHRADVDPYRPAIARSRVNHVTGETTREIYGLFPMPVAIADEEFITSRQFNPYGVFVSATVFENGRTPEDFARPLPSRLNEPIVGRERFRKASTIPAAELAQLRNLKAQGYMTSVSRRDLARGDVITQAFDNGHWGRKLREGYVDRFGGTNRLAVEITLEYRDTSWFGVIPTKATHRSAASGQVILQAETRSYDPFLKQLQAVEVDATGRRVTNLWNYGFGRPIESLTDYRKTVYRYNRDATEFSAITTVASTGEEIILASGRFDTNAQHWRAQRIVWWRRGITNESQSLIMSDRGRVLALRVGDTFERRPVYNAEGVEHAVNVYRKHPASGQFQALQQLEDDFHWQQGQRDARIQTYVEGRPYDTFRRVTDAEGRIRTDQIRQVAGLALETKVQYDDASERRVQEQALQNGRPRWTRQWQPEERQANGAFQLTVKTVPAWGLALTESFRTGDPLARPVSARLENDDTLHATEWFEGMGIAKMLEWRDRNGRLRERCARRLNAGTDGALAYDTLERQRLTYWGAVLVTETNAYLRGTDRLLFTARPGEKVYADLTEPFEAPGYAVDPAASAGIQMLVRGESRDHLVKLFRSRVEAGADPLLAVDTLDLSQGVPSQITRKVWDRGGNLVDQHWFALPAVGNIAGSDQTLWELTTRGTFVERVHYRYQPGWLVQRVESAGPSRVLVFTNALPKPGTASVAINQSRRREFMTAIDGVKAAPAARRSETGLRNYFFRRAHDPVLHERNPLAPDREGAFTSWAVTELSPEGAPLSETEAVYDAFGNLLAANRPKRAVQPPTPETEAPDDRPASFATRKKDAKTSP